MPVGLHPIIEMTYHLSSPMPLNIGVNACWEYIRFNSE